MENGIKKNEIISALTKSPHGALKEYAPIGRRAAAEEPEFLQHLIAYNQIKGQIRDSKVALPVIALSGGHMDPEFVSNSLAHVAMLDPRNLVRAYRFFLELRDPKNQSGRHSAFRRVLAGYLRQRESVWPKWERMAVQHRSTVKELYALCHIKPSPMADAILFKGERPKGSVFEAIANLKNMSNTEAAGTIMERRIPFLIAMGALGAKAKEVDLVLALIERMSPTELVTNSKMLERLGIKTNPALRAAYEQALGRAATSKKSTFKTTRAVEALVEQDEDSPIADKLRSLQEKQIQSLGGVDGNWLVLADKSGSMAHAIEISRQVAATLARVVKGNVYLVFFDVSPRFVDVTGKTYEQIVAETKHVTAGGGTSIGCGLLAITEKKLEVDGIAIISDGEENQHPMFPHVYKAYSESIGKEVPVYFYRTVGGMNVLTRNMATAGIDMQEFDLTGGTDYHALGNVITTMRTNRYSLAQEILDTPLWKLEDVLPAMDKVYA